MIKFTHTGNVTVDGFNFEEVKLLQFSANINPSSDFLCALWRDDSNRFYDDQGEQLNGRGQYLLDIRSIHIVPKERNGSVIVDDDKETWA